MPNGPWSSLATPAAATASFTDLVAGASLTWGSLFGASAQASPAGGWSTAATFASTVSRTFTVNNSTATQCWIPFLATSPGSDQISSNLTFTPSTGTLTVGGPVSMGALTATGAQINGTINASVAPGADYINFQESGITKWVVYAPSAGKFQFWNGSTGATLTLNSDASATFASSVTSSTFLAGTASATAAILSNWSGSNWLGFGCDGTNHKARIGMVSAAGVWQAAPGDMVLQVDGAATFASSVSMGALTATGGTFALSQNGYTTVTVRNADTTTANYNSQAMFLVSMAGNDVGALKSTAKNLVGLSRQSLYLTTLATYDLAFGVGGSATPSFVIDGSTQAATFNGNPVSMGALTATSDGGNAAVFNGGTSSYKSQVLFQSCPSDPNYYTAFLQQANTGFTITNTNFSKTTVSMNLYDGKATFSGSITATGGNFELSQNGITSVVVRNPDTTTSGFGTQAQFLVSVAGNDIGALKSTARNLNNLSRSSLYLTTLGAYNIAFGVGGGATPSFVIDGVTGNPSYCTGYTEFADRAAPGTFNNRFLSRSGNSLMWRYDGSNDGELLHMGNVGTNAATLMAAVASATAPMVGSHAAMVAYGPGSGTTPYWYAVDDLETDGLYGKLWHWNGSSWVAVGTPSTVAGRITAGVISAGAIGAQALAADIALIGQVLRNTGFTAGTSSNPPVGFKLSGSTFTATLLDGTTIPAYAEIGGEASIGGYKAAIIANRVRGNLVTRSTAGTTDILIPDGVVLVEVTLQAAGGNGSSSYGAGGNAGQYVKLQIAVNPHNTYRITAGAVGSNSTFSWVSFDGTSGFTTDSGFSTITATCGANGGASGGTGEAGSSVAYPFPGPESGWNISGASGGDGAAAASGISSGVGGGVTGIYPGGNGSATTGTKAAGGGGGASAMAAGGGGKLNPANGGAGSSGSGGGGGNVGGTGGAAFCRVRW